MSNLLRSVIDAFSSKKRANTALKLFNAGRVIILNDPHLPNPVKQALISRCDFIISHLANRVSENPTK